MAKARRVDPRKPSPVDVALGHNVRFWRLARGLSQTQLANRLGITFQQVQKYEAGDNRVSIGRLVKTAAILRIPIAALFAGTETDGRLLALIYDSRSFRLAHAFAAITKPPWRTFATRVRRCSSGARWSSCFRRW